MDSKKIEKILKNSIRIIILAIAAWLVTKQDYTNAILYCFFILVTFYNVFFKKVCKIELDISLQICLDLFILLAQVCGTMLEFYDKFIWWDVMLHTLSGPLAFYVGINLLKEIAKKTKSETLNPIILIVFGICFSLSIITCWEMIEYITDSFFGTNMQRADNMLGQLALQDTMWDMIFATIGTIGISIFEIIKNKKKK